MTAFLPIPSNLASLYSAAQQNAITPPLPSDSTHSPLVNIELENINQLNTRFLPSSLAASLREPDKEPPPEDFNSMLSQLLPFLFESDSPAQATEGLTDKPLSEKQDSRTQTPLAPKALNNIDLSKIDFKKLWAQTQQKIKNKNQPGTQPSKTNDIDIMGWPSDYLNFQVSNSEDNNDSFDTGIISSTDPNDQNTLPRLPIPSTQGNLFGQNEKHKAVLNAITLQTPWPKQLKNKEIMTLLKLGLVNRYVYQKLALRHHEAHIADFEKKLEGAGYGIKTISIGDNLWGIIAHRDNEALLCFRGTAFWDDMWRNIQFWPSLDKTVPENECTHHGMSHVFEQLWPKIEKSLTDISKTVEKPLKLYLSGHSLGGSFAKLTALRLSNKQQANNTTCNANLQMVCTYGAPKTFFTPSAARYRELGLDHKTITITQHQDIIPELPPNFLSPYETVGNRLYISRDGSLWYKPENDCVDEDKFRETPEEAAGNGRPNRWVSDHGLDSYLLVLQAYANTKLPKPLPPGSCPTYADRMIKVE